MRILLLNGPNLNMLGIREPQKYGSETLKQIENELIFYANEQEITLDAFQSNYEGALIDKIHQALGVYDGIIINAGAYTHTSIALRDALLSIQIPFVEVHMTNIYARESFRHKSLLSDIAVGVVAGFHKKSYFLALDGLIPTLRKP